MTYFTTMITSHCAETGLRSKLALAVLKEYYARKRKADAEAAMKGTIWFAERRIEGVECKHKYSTIKVVRLPSDEIGILARVTLGRPMERALCKKRAATELANLLLTVTEMNTHEQVMKMSQYPANMADRMCVSMPSVKLSQMCCLIDMLCSTSKKKDQEILKRYGKEVVESLTVCDLNPIEMEQRRVLLAEVESADIEASEAIDEVKIEADRRIREIEKKREMRSSALLEQLESCP